VRLVIAEDSTLFREGLSSLLTEVGHEVIAAVGDAEAAVQAVVEHRPDVAILDIRMPPDHTDDGARAAVTIRSLVPEVGVLLLSQHVEARHSIALIGGGRFGYLLKDRVLEVADFVDALERIAAGGSALDPEVVARLLAAGRGTLTGLTSREFEVLGLMAEGMTNSGIATRLVLGERTVESHIASIFVKLDLAETGPGEHRRVRAVLAFLDGVRDAPGRPPRRDGGGDG